MTALIHHLHHGFLTPLAIFTFLTCLIVAINVWIYQSVFTNRFGRNSLWDIAVQNINIAIILFLSNTFTTENWEAVFKPYAIMSGLSTVCLMVQYWMQLPKMTNCNDEIVVRNYCIILGIRSAIILISSIIPYNIGIILFFIGVFQELFYHFL